MDAQTFWILAHVLLFVYWLGADIGVFISSLQIINRNHSMETRLAIAKILGIINSIPGFASQLMLVVGLQLAANLGLSPISSPWLWLAWIGTAVWIVVAKASERRRSTPLGRNLANLDLLIRVLLIVALTAAALWSFVTGTPFVENWLALKALIFAYVLACGIGIRFAFASFGPALARMAKEGFNPETEAALRWPVIWVKPWVIALWTGLIVAAFVGIGQSI